MGLSEERALRGRGGKGHFQKQMLLALDGKLLKSEFNSLTDNPQLWRETNKTQSLSPVHRCKRLVLSVYAGP